MPDDVTLDPVDITKSFGALQALLAPDRKTNRSELWQAWHFLQVYATWGVRLPVKETDFTALMGVSPAAYGFYPPMKDGNTTICNACKAFLKHVYPRVLQVGVDLKAYAEDAASSDSEMFQTVIDMIDEDDMESALIFLNDLQTDAQAAATHAKEAGEKLTAFRVELDMALGQLATAQTSLQTDEKTNQDKLATLHGGEGVEGSLKQYKHQLAEMKARHTEATIAAATSPLYVWVAPPLGLIATGTVMGVYTDKAIKAMKEIERLEDLIAKANKQLSAAISAGNIYAQGRDGLTNVISYTTAASAKCGIVQQAWTEMTSQIDNIKKKINRTTTETDDGEVVHGKKQVEVYLRKVEQAWDKLLPDLRDLLTDNYISVEPDQKSLGEVIELIEAAQN